ncbi:MULTISPECIES: hypothetical protein [Rhodomicrobium]|uniref:hypothetical protein n=1 Tax=Rhodomicrobium TaxID=1068 RepID=UPI000B4AC19C|nr:MULTISPECIES: hypothetical protein [Rhodomicrobium]
MQRSFKTAIVLLCVVCSAGLSGCADSLYPRLPDLGGTSSNLLTPQQQEQTIKDLTTEQRTHGAEAAKTIEAR